MNVNNQHNAYLKKRSDDASIMTDSIINKLLEKYNFNKVAETVRIDNIPLSSNKNEKSDGVRKETCNDSSKTPENFNKPSIGDILQRYSIKYNDNANNKEDSAYDLENYNHLINNTEDNSLLYGNAFKNHFENKRNLEANLAFLKNKITIRSSKNENNRQTNQHTEFNSNKSYAEKTTYCRPVCNLYNQEFIFKTLDRNAKLQALLKKLILARRKEKEKEQWNNYVNELKNKHDYYSTQPRHIVPQHVPQGRFFLESNDIYKINQAEPNTHPMNDFYAYADSPFHEYCYSPTHEMVGEGSRYGALYENEMCCYPTSSQGRLMMLQRERARQNHDPVKRKLPPYRTIDLHPKFVFVDKEPKKCCEDVGCCYPEPESYPAYPLTICKCNSTEATKNKDTTATSVQTESCETCCKLDETTKEKYDKVTKNVNRLKAQIESNEEKIQRQNSLWKLESKIDMLIKNIDILMAELNAKSSSTSLCSTNANVNKPEIDKERCLTCKIPKRVQSVARQNESVYVGHAETNTSMTAFQTFPNKLRHFEPTTRIDNIICEELDKSNKLRRELGELLHTQIRQHHSVQITVDIPTRERATEVTDSLSRAVLCDKGIEEMGSSLDIQDSQITSAVNTDPLGLLTLLTMSTDVVKQLISYVPSVDYGWYLSRLPLPQISGRSVTDFVCNICGATFARPSQLSDHMKYHDLGDTKDCCVCRHVLDLNRRSRGLFTCRYCGQRFTRAYCCELHQQSCARALGFLHDVDSSLALLR